MFKVCGYKKEDGVPSYADHEKTWHPDDWKMFDAAVKACGLGTPYNIVVRIWFPEDKSYHYINTQGFPKKNDRGEIVELFGTSQDVTEIKNAEFKFEESERKYQNIIESMTNAFGLHEMIFNENDEPVDYRFLEVNPGWEDVVGLKAKDVIGKTIREIMPTIEDYWIELYGRIVKTGKAEDFEQYNEATDKYYHVYAYRHKGNQFAVVFNDISNRKQYENALKESEEKYRFLIENQNELILKFNALDNSILFASPGYMRVFGLNSSTELKKSFLSFTHKDDKDLAIKAILSLQKPPHTSYLEERVKTVNGWKWYAWSFKATYNENKSMLETVAVGRDITERKKIEEEKNISEFRYSQLINTMNSGVAIYKVLNDGKHGDDYIIQDFNKTALKLENKTLKEVVGKSLKDLRPNIEEYGLLKIFRKVWKTGEPEFYPAKIYIDDNYTNYYENRVFKLPNNEIVAIYDDVTERETANLKIAESEKRFELAMRATKDGLYDWNLITNEIYYSPGWKSMLGYEYDELPNDFSVWEKLTDSEDVKRSWEMLAKCTSGELDRFEMEFKMKHKDGHWVDILSRAEAIFNDKGKAVRMIGTHVDISDLLKAEQRARESDERYRIFYNNSPIPYQSLNEDGIIQDVNPKWLNTLGYDPGEVIGKNFGDFLHPSWKEHFKKNFPKFKAQGAINNVHFKIRCKDGHYIDTSFDGRIGTDPQGHFMQTHCVFQDITETKQAQERILKLSTAVEQSPSIIVITDTKGNVEYANPKFTELTGYTTEEIIGQSTNILRSDEFTSELYDEMWDTISSGKEWHGEFHNKTKNNSLYWEAASISPIFDEQGEITNFIKVAENITERKESEIKLSAALEKAKESDKLKSAFLANMSHEIRTPMNGILGFSELLNQPDLDSGKRSDYIEIIKKSGKRMLSTINDLIDISRIEAHQINISKKQINFNQHLNHFYQFFKPDAEDKGLSLEYIPSLTDDNANIVTDEEKFDAIISNFINNAIKYTHEGYIKFGYEVKSGHIEFYVEDSGIGVPTDKQESIFERFIQADHSLTKPYEGSGLGLAISKAYAEMIDGKIRLDSIQGKGSTFYLKLPIGEISETPATITISQSKAPEDLNILLVEDDETSRLFMMAVLEDKCKTLHTAATGKIAIEKAQQVKDLDLILMDIKLPDTNGYDVTKEIRKSNKDVMIIAQTAFAMETDHNKALSAGCDGYITKPIIQKDLFEMISQVMKEKHEKKR